MWKWPRACRILPLKNQRVRRILSGGRAMQRRDFLKGAAGLVLCSCGMLDAAHAQNGERRLPVKIKGKRIKTIDVHSHCHFHESLALRGDEVPNIMPKTKGAKEHFIAIESRLKGMDAMAIDMEVLSINPFWYRKDRDT